MKYKSELIKDIVDTRGHEKSSLHYESECVGAWIEEAKGAYPKLCDYESEWLNYINEKPIGNFPYETVTANPTATINNVVPYAYKTAILKGNTKYRDIDTGDILDTFDETKNLELVSVKMPALTTTGKNLFHSDIQVFNNSNYIRTGNNTNNVCDTELKPSTTYTLSWNGNNMDGKISLYSNGVKTNSINIGWYKSGVTFTTNEVEDGFSFYTQLSDDSSLTSDMSFNVQLEEGTTTTTTYEPYQTNILTVNEDVTLRSNGSVYDELDLLTGKLTQRIDENGEVLSQEVVKTVDLSIQDQDGNTLRKIKPIEGTMHITASGTPINPTVSLEVPVEAITQNLSSFIEGE